jgi:hypothetical protein
MSDIDGSAEYGQIFDGNSFDPQFAIALRNFIAKNLPKRANSGFVSVTGSTTHFAIPHGLIGTPTLISISTFPSTGGAVVVSTTAPPADETNIYVDNSTTARTTYWAAAVI